MAAVIGSGDFALPLGGEVKKKVRTGSTSDTGTTVKHKLAKQTLKLKSQPEKASFFERLRSSGDMKSKKLPIILEAEEKEVEEYMKENSESVPFRWHYHSPSGKFFIDELNDTIHESLIQELSRQLSNEAIQYEGFFGSGADACVAPSTYGIHIEPDACIRYARKVPKANRKNAADSKGRYYPSVVVEVGFSQGKDGLKQKIDAWFLAGDDITGVRCVVEINIDYQDPPTFVNYRLVRRGQRRPPYKTMMLDKFGDPGEANKHNLSIPSEDFFYPMAKPDDVDSIDIEVGVAYKTVLALTQLESDEEEEDDEEDGDGEEADEDVPAKKRART
eukprot:CAMPEP_0117027534 /NCGR_PEP_ID=MMETSP0472-20121206/20119_1 /TAXON_ID=693140 ORGANISM="Tiarina fusus, Strain LIS" /NCGR_SAMPLE_ID=MMETSP0472 /ASSEMBLY_ACC=CAM_ASM_000603 /LENGTH=331 /DNA_ID=CAMNT_0004734809 /DNA_START=95 /DNA_END=1090 /DNA_ORIENTATION=+